MTAALARRGLLAGLVAGLLFLLAPPLPAQAHANVVDTDPADGEVLEAAPATLTIRFDEPVTLASSGNQLFDAQGARVASDFSVRDATVRVTPAATLRDGTYVLSWRVISGDSHPITGAISFSVGAPSEKVVTVPTPQAEREVTVLKGFAEFLRYAGVLLFSGLAIFLSILAGPVTRRDIAVRNRLIRATLVAGAAAVTGALALIPLTALWESGEGLAAFGAAITRSGPAAASATLVVLAVGIGWFALRYRHGPLLAAAVITALGSLIIVGHTRTYGPYWLVLTADASHIAAAATWAGGVVGLLILLLARPRASDAADAVSRFSAVAAWSVGVLGVAAVVLYWRIAGSIEGLWQTTYGRLVLAKFVATVIVALIGGWNRRTLVPRVRRSADAAATLRRTLAAEATVLAVVVGLTSALVAAAPPLQSPVATADEPSAVVLDIGDVGRAQIRITPGEQGDNTVEVVLSDTEGEPLELPEPPELSAALDEPRIGPFTPSLSLVEPGTYRTTAEFPRSGSWTIRLGVRLSRFEEPVVTGELEIR